MKNFDLCDTSKGLRLDYSTFLAKTVYFPRTSRHLPSLNNAEAFVEMLTLPNLI